jgi:hypothetical protein
MCTYLTEREREMKPLIAPLLVLLVLVAAVSATSVPLRRRTNEIDKNGNRYLASIFGSCTLLPYFTILYIRQHQSHMLLDSSSRTNADNGTGNLQGYAYEWHSPSKGKSSFCSFWFNVLPVKECELRLCCKHKSQL